jgi:hypothetical protein
MSATSRCSARLRSARRSACSICQACSPGLAVGQPQRLQALGRLQGLDVGLGLRLAARLERDRVGVALRLPTLEVGGADLPLGERLCGSAHGWVVG